MVAGAIVAGPYVRAACERHLADLKRKDLVWDTEAVLRVVGFFRDILTVEIERRDDYGAVESLAVPFNLEPWQAFVVGSIFGWKTQSGLRRFRRAFVEIGKGNGKSPMAAGIGHYMLTASGKIRAEVYSAATDKDQAAILFRDAVSMWERSPGLRHRLVASGINPVWQLTDLKKASFFKPISSEKKGKSGIRPYCALIDEVHEHPDNSVIEMLRAGTKGNQEALLFEITNSGFDRLSVCWNEHQYSIEVVTGVKDNDAWFSFVASVDSEARTETYDLDESVRKMLESCTCNAKITPKELPEASAFAQLVIRETGAPVISKTASPAKITQTELFLLEVFATVVTKNPTLLTTPKRRQKDTQPLNDGEIKTPIESGQSNNDIGKDSEFKIPAELSQWSESENTESLSKRSINLTNSRTAFAEFADPRSRLYDWIIAILRELSGASSVTSAMLELVCSEILTKVFSAHSPTCKCHLHYYLKNGKLNRDFIADNPLDDETCWIKANPNLGVSIQLKYIREQVLEAKGMPSKEGLVRRLHFCEWTESETSAIPRKVWMACVAAPDEINPEALCAAGNRPFGGLDLSRTRDLCAFTLTWVLDPTPDAWRFASKTWFWTPKDTLAERAKTDHAPYVEWEKAGFLEAVPGPRVSYRWLAEALAGLCATYDPVTIGCDQYGLERLNDQLGEIGATLPCVVHPQGFQRRVIDKKEATDLLGVTGAEEIALWMPDSILKFEAALLEQRIRIDPNPVMNMGAAAVVYEQNRTGHRMFAKDKATSRIDGMVSTAMSIGVATVKSVPKDDIDGYIASLGPKA